MENLCRAVTLGQMERDFPNAERTTGRCCPLGRFRGFADPDGFALQDQRSVLKQCEVCLAQGLALCKRPFGFELKNREQRGVAKGVVGKDMLQQQNDVWNGFQTAVLAGIIEDAKQHILWGW